MQFVHKLRAAILAGAITAAAAAHPLNVLLK
jgi:hypothetical protein